jgi:hypothetical protein
VIDSYRPCVGKIRQEPASVFTADPVKAPKKFPINSAILRLPVSDDGSLTALRSEQMALIPPSDLAVKLHSGRSPAAAIVVSLMKSSTVSQEMVCTQTS